LGFGLLEALLHKLKEQLFNDRFEAEPGKAEVS